MALTLLAVRSGFTRDDYYRKYRDNNRATDGQVVRNRREKIATDSQLKGLN